MTPEDKAKELVDRFEEFVDGYTGENLAWDPEEALKMQKNIALICCDEIISEYDGLGEDDNGYWQQVKEEINKL